MLRIGFLQGFTKVLYTGRIRSFRNSDVGTSISESEILIVTIPTSAGGCVPGECDGRDWRSQESG